jgi:mannose-1-phosphate guanylyltransferase / phosphomannomutase
MQYGMRSSASSLTAFERLPDMYAAIVAGGLGTRATGLTGGGIPKALLPVAGVPIIFRQMRILRREGIRGVKVLAGHLGDRLLPELAPEAAALELALEIVVEPQPLGTAGCLSALAPAEDDVLIVYGDMLFDLTLAPLQDFHRRQDALLTVVAHPNDHPRTSDLLIEDDGLVKAILPHRQARVHDYRNLVPAGVYLASPEFFNHIHPAKKADMIHEVLPSLLASNARVAVYNTPEYLRDVGTSARHALAGEDITGGRVGVLNKSHPRPAIFFDCDGVLNEEPGLQGAVTASDIKIIPGAGAAVRRAREVGQLTVAVTNRPQVAKGLVTFEGLNHILGRLEALLAADGGVLDRLYFCPHHPESGFPGEIPALKIRCECRKPGTLLLRRALEEMPIERQRSTLIGDSLRDVGAARGLGIWAYGVQTGYGCRDGHRYAREFGTPPVPDLMFRDVSEAVNFVIDYEAMVAPVLAAIRNLIAAGRAPVLVGVCGRSRSGKTAVSHAIDRALTEEGVSSLHIRLDYWIVPAAERESNSSAEFRNRVAAIPDVIRDLRGGTNVRAPGYDAASRGPGEPKDYDPSGRSVILLDGSFAAHETILEMLDYNVFVAVPEELQQRRFANFYRWKGFNETAIETLWRQRTIDEWPAVDAQQPGADLILAPMGGCS